MTNVTNQTWVFTPTIEICFIIQGSVISMTILFTQIIVIGKSYFGERHKSLVNVMSIGGRAQNLFGGGGGGRGEGAVILFSRKVLSKKNTFATVDGGGGRAKKIMNAFPL